MSQYATLYAAAKKFNAIAVISQHMETSLSKIFPNLSIKSLPPNRSFKWTVMGIGSLSEDTFRTTCHVHIGDYPVEVPIFDPYRKALSLSDFKMKTKLELAAKRFLRSVAKDTGAQVFVGIHVRRTDYSVWLKEKINGRLLSKLYFSQARAILEQNYKDKKVAFIVASDDRAWCKAMFANETGYVLTEQFNKAEQDLAILAQTNHSIIRFDCYQQKVDILLKD